MSLNGLSNINIELTSRCNKNCWCCGRRKIDREFPQVAMNYGDMSFSLLEKIALQIPDGIVVQLHNNGEPLLYPKFGEAVKLFKEIMRPKVSIDTNGKLLVEKADEIINNLDTIAISVIENDLEADEQYEIIKKFLKKRGYRKPIVIFRLNGKIEEERYRDLGEIIAKRVLHNPLGSYDYTNSPTIPEIGVCLDLLHHLSIDRFGNVSCCVRFDPEGVGIIGDANTQPLNEIWNSSIRKLMIESHFRGNRKEWKLCSKCEYFGVPTSR
jgi:MoaA/NifB/PqqE/SkfB family radical SAM enzyme